MSVSRPTLLMTLALSMIVGWSSLANAQTSKPVAKGGNEWPQYRGADRSGVSPEKDWSDWGTGKPTVLWTANVGAGYSSFSVKNGRVYTMGFADGKDTIYCFDADKGTEIWKQSYASKPHKDYPGPRCTPTVDDKYVFTIGEQGDFACLDAAKGTPIWSKNLVKDYGCKNSGWLFSTSPLLEGDQIIIDVGLTMAINKADGSVAWKTAKDYGTSYSSAMAFTQGGKNYYAVFPVSGLVVLDNKGTQVAAFPWTTDCNCNAATPIYTNGEIFISSGYNHGAAVLTFDGSSLKQKWTNKNMRNHFNSCVLDNGVVYGFDESDLACVDLKDGSVKWKTGGYGKGSCMLADGRLIVLAEDGTLSIGPVSSAEKFKPTASARVLKKDTCWTVPVLCNGKLYCRSHGGEVVCIDLSKAK